MKRLDLSLVEWGLAPSRTKAQAMIEAGEIEIFKNDEWCVTSDQSAKAERQHVRVREGGETLRYVSRGGLKLEAAARQINLNVRGLRCLDVGISTGGFTDYLLQSGAAAVLGVDVGHGQLSEKLADDRRLRSFEGVHVKDIAAHGEISSWLKSGVHLCVIDVSFISLEHVLPMLAPILPKGCRLLALVKPQFEVGAKTVREEMFSEVRERILAALAKTGFSPVEYFPSSVRGQDGNQEFFVWANRG